MMLNTNFAFRQALNHAHVVLFQPGSESLLEVKKCLDKAYIGVGAVNIIQPPTGLFDRIVNNRGISIKNVNDLVKSFAENGMCTCDTDTIMHCVIRRKWVSTATLVKDLSGLGILEVPVIEWTPGGLAAMLGSAGPLWASGNHRRRAALHMAERATEILNTLQPKIEKLRSKINAGKGGKAAEAELEALEQRVMWQQAYKVGPTRWAVALYDLGMYKHSFNSLRMY